MKKLVLLCAILLCFSMSAQAKTVRDGTKEVLDYLKIEESGNTSAIRKCKNYASISEDDVPLAATAIDAGVLIPKDRVLNMDSEDLTPLVNGLTSYGIKNGYKVVTGKFGNNQIEKTPVTEDTFSLCELVNGEEYTALIKNNVCQIVMPVGDIKKPVLYTGRIFIAQGNIISFDNVQRYSMGEWMDSGLHGKLLFGTPVGFSVSEYEINTNYIDKTVYFYGDTSEDVVKIYGMRW